jgi:hypothetical protein
MIGAAAVQVKLTMDIFKTVEVTVVGITLVEVTVVSETLVLVETTVDVVVAVCVARQVVVEVTVEVGAGGQTDGAAAVVVGLSHGTSPLGFAFAETIPAKVTSEAIMALMFISADFLES